MSVENLIARIDNARDQNQSARSILTGIGGAMIGISLRTYVVLRPVGRLANFLEDSVDKARLAFNELPAWEGGPVSAKTYGGETVTNGVTGKRDLTEQSEARAHQVGTDFHRQGRDAKDFEGSTFHSHAERLAERLNPGQPGAVNKPMCDGYNTLKTGKRQRIVLDIDPDCRSHFQNMAVHDNEIKVWADPDGTKIFYPDAGTDNIAHDAGHSSVYQSALESTTRSLYEQGGSRYAFMQAMENVPLRRGLRALGPIGAVLDGVSLYQAWEADGGTFGEEFKTTAGGVVGGIVGGAATGAAIGTLVPIPIVGTVVGGLIGGILGSMAGETIGEAL
jgi:hypothetical protein